MTWRLSAVSLQKLANGPTLSGSLPMKAPTGVSGPGPVSWAGEYVTQETYEGCHRGKGCAHSMATMERMYPFHGGRTNSSRLDGQAECEQTRRRRTSTYVISQLMLLHRGSRTMLDVVSTRVYHLRVVYYNSRYASGGCGLVKLSSTERG